MNRQQTRYVKLLDQERKTEADMRRAFRKWEKVRAQRLRAEKKLDQEFKRRSGSAPEDIEAQHAFYRAATDFNDEV
jgi:hypothetical protein